MKTMRRPKRRTVIIAATGLLVGLVALAAVVGVVRSDGFGGGGGTADGGAAMLPALEEPGLDGAEDTKSLGEPLADADAERTAETAGGDSGGTTVTLPPVTVPGQHLVRSGQLAVVVGRDTLDDAVSPGHHDHADLRRVRGVQHGRRDRTAAGRTTGAVSLASGHVHGAPGPRTATATRTRTSRCASPPSGSTRRSSDCQKLGRVRELSTSTDDVTAQIVDLRARLRHYRAVEERLLSFLDKADTVAAALAVQDRIDRHR